jgi:hypothetical protein
LQPDALRVCGWVGRLPGRFIVLPRLRRWQGWLTVRKASRVRFRSRFPKSCNHESCAFLIGLTAEITHLNGPSTAASLSLMATSKDSMNNQRDHYLQWRRTCFS